MDFWHKDKSRSSQHQKVKKAKVWQNLFQWDPEKANNASAWIKTSRCPLQCLWLSFQGPIKCKNFGVTMVSQCIVTVSQSVISCSFPFVRVEHIICIFKTFLGTVLHCDTVSHCVTHCDTDTLCDSRHGCYIRDITHISLPCVVGHLMCHRGPALNGYQKSWVGEGGVKKCFLDLYRKNLNEGSWIWPDWKG